MSDLISRQAAIKAICEDGTMFERQGKYTMTMAERKQKDADILDSLPSAQPGCEDAVSRADVDILIEEAQTAWLRGDILLMYPALKKGLQKVPPVTPKQPGWIPTSERLPDNDRAVLVTLKWAEDDYEVAVGEYWHNSTASHGWGSFEGHVIAWHELPTPYREGEQDEQN